jgi:hypothetical protein
MLAMSQGIKEKCELHHAGGLEEWCTRQSCIFWRLIEAQDEEESNKTGCGLQHFRVIETLKPDMAEWLLNLKKQLENTNPDKEVARITFKRREH